MGHKIIMKEAYSTKRFLTIAIPIIIQGMVFQLQNIADKSFLGNLKTEYLTAVGVTQSPFHMTMTIVMAIATGLGIIVGHRYGARQMDEVKDSIRSTISYNMILSFVLLGIWLLFGRQFFSLINVDEEVIPYAMTYMGIITLYLPLYAIDSSIQASLQAFGVTKPIMYVGMMKVLLNVVLDWILIFGKFGFPALGIEGAAIATLLSNVLASALLMIYFFRTQKLPIHMTPREIFGFNGVIYKRIASLGLPTGGEFFLWHIGNLVLISLLNTISDSGVAVYVLTTSIGVMSFMIYIAFSQATMTLISQGLGAGDFEYPRKIMSRSVTYILSVITVFVGFVLLFKVQFLDIFTDDQKLIQMTLPMIGYLLLTLFPKSMNVVFGHGIRALGKTKWMLFSQIGGTCLVVIMSYILMYFARLGLEAIFITVLVDEGVRSIINIWYFIEQTRPEKIHKHVFLKE